MSDKPSGLLARWSLRRQQVQQEEEAEQMAQHSPEQATATIEPANETSPVESSDDNKILMAADLPDPESIEVGGSFASFMANNVDPNAKAAALRALWKQPHYSEIDGLLEYALDYTNQPKLSPEVSAELAKKVFRHLNKDDEQQDPPNESLEAEEMIASNTTQDANLPGESPADILDEELTNLSQNEPESQGAPKPPVA